MESMWYWFAGTFASQAGVHYNSIHLLLHLPSYLMCSVRVAGPSTLPLQSILLARSTAVDNIIIIRVALFTNPRKLRTFVLIVSYILIPK